MGSVGEPGLRFVIAMPILGEQELSFEGLPLMQGWPPSWTTNASGLTRQLAFMGNRTFSSAKVKHIPLQLPHLGLAKNVEIHYVIQVQKRGVFNQIVLVGETKKALAAKIHELRCPGNQATRALYRESFQIDLDYSKTVYATTITSQNLDEIESKNGLLIVEAKTEFAFDVSYSLMASAICAERIILESATEMVFTRDYLGFGSRRHLARLSNWLSIPSSDSTKLIKEVELLRSNLDLSSRTNQVTKVLESRIRPIDYSIAAFIGSIGIVSSFLSGFSENHSVFGFGWPIETLSKAIISFVVALLTYGVLRRR